MSLICTIFAETTGPHKSGTSTKWIHWLLFASFLLNLLVSSIWIAGFSSLNLLGSYVDKFDILTSFDETDSRYQSLDTRHDDLWNGHLSLANSSGILDVPDSHHKDGFQRLGGLAM